MSRSFHKYLFHPADLQILVDETMPPGTVELRSPGKDPVRIVNISSGIQLCADSQGVVARGIVIRETVQTIPPMRPLRWSDEEIPSYSAISAAFRLPDPPRFISTFSVDTVEYRARKTGIRKRARRTWKGRHSDRVLCAMRVT